LLGRFIVEANHLRALWGRAPDFLLFAGVRAGRPGRK
jgi:hypothetical protein